MSSSHTAPQIAEKTPAESRNVAVSFAGRLDDGELLTGTPTVSVTPSGLTLSEAVVNVTALTINGRSVDAGQAVQFKASSGSADTLYKIDITSETDGSQTLEGFVLINVVDA